jgi:hypothetical protein
MFAGASRVSRRTDAPQFLQLLGATDQFAYDELRTHLSSPACRNRRHQRLESFNEMLDAIKSFAIQGSDDDWKRCLVCGVIWLPGSIAINTRQLRLLIDKCKSSINGSLHRMGYSSVTSRGDTNRQLREWLPSLRGNFGELRQWTVRQLSACAPQPAPMGDFAMSPEPTCEMEVMWPRTETASFDDELTLPLRDWIEENERMGNALEIDGMDTLTFCEPMETAISF